MVWTVPINDFHHYSWFLALPYLTQMTIARGGKSRKYRYCTCSSTWSWSIYRIRFYGRLLSRRFSDAFTRMTGMIHESGIRHARLGVALLALSTDALNSVYVSNWDNSEAVQQWSHKIKLVMRIYLVTHHWMATPWSLISSRIYSHVITGDFWWLLFICGEIYLFTKSARQKLMLFTLQHL